MTKRRELGVTVLAVVVIGAVLWLAGRGMATHRIGVGGRQRDASPVEALGVAVLLSGIALVAVRGRARWLIGAAIVLLGAGAELVAGSSQVGGAGRMVALSVAPFAVAAGLWVAVRGTEWPAMGARYEPPAKAQTAADEASMWEALDRGEDPTAV